MKKHNRFYRDPKDGASSDDADVKDEGENGTREGDQASDAGADKGSEQGEQ